jgi:hypothetical protein
MRHMSLSRHLRGVLVGVFVVLTTVTLVEVLLPRLGFLWHLINRSDVTVDGFSFVVHPKYFLSRSDGGTYFVRFSPVVPFVSGRSAIRGAFAKRNLIGIYANPERRAFNSDVDYARLKVWLTNEARSVGPYQQTEKTFNTQDGAALCFQFNRPESVEVRCFLDGSSVTVVFEGEPRFVDDVYQVVSGARKKGR